MSCNIDPLPLEFVTTNCPPVNPFKQDFCITGTLTENTKVMSSKNGLTTIYLDIDLGDSYSNLITMDFNRRQGVTLFDQTPDAFEKLMECFRDRAILRIESIDGILTVEKLNQ